MDIHTLLHPLSDDAPCGEDLEYDSEFLALEKSAQGKPEQQFGDTIVPAEEPDWPIVATTALSLFDRTRDLRVAILLTRAWCRLEGMAGLQQGLELIEGLLEQQWDFVHPCLDPDDGDATIRINVLSAMADNQALLRELRAITLVGATRHERMSVRDILIACGQLPGAEEAVSLAEVSVALAAEHNVAFAVAARAALQASNKIRNTLNDRLGIGEGPELAPLSNMLKAVVQVCDNAAPAGASVMPAAAGAEQTENMISATVAHPAAGEIRNRDDVVKMLEKVCQFLERTEPANPAPLLIRRAQRLVTMSFFEIMAELAPDSLEQIYNISGTKPDED